MEEARTDMQGRAVRWPRLLGAILLAAGVQAGLGAWTVGGGPVAAYLGGCAATAGVIGVLLLAVPLHPARSQSGAWVVPPSLYKVPEVKRKNLHVHRFC